MRAPSCLVRCGMLVRRAAQPGSRAVTQAQVLTCLASNQAHCEPSECMHPRSHATGPSAASTPQPQRSHHAAAIRQPIASDQNACIPKAHATKPPAPQPQQCRADSQVYSPPAPVSQHASARAQPREHSYPTTKKLQSLSPKRKKLDSRARLHLPTPRSSTTTTRSAGPLRTEIRTAHRYTWLTPVRQGRAAAPGACPCPPRGPRRRRWWRAGCTSCRRRWRQRCPRPR